MKVVHVINVLSAGGRERRLSQLSADLHKREGIDNYVIVTRNEGIAYSVLSECGAQVIELKETSWYKALLKVTRELYKIRPDIVQIWNAAPEIVLSCIINKLILRYKLVGCIVADANPWGNMKMRIMASLTYRFSETILSNSKAGLIAKKAPIGKSRVIYNGFDFSRIKAKTNEEKILLKKNLGINDEKVVAMIARVEPDKNYAMFLNLAERMKQDNVIFLSVGKGNLLPYYEEERKKRRLDNVKFLGYRTDVEDLLQISDVVLLLSSFGIHLEGVSNAIMEAMAVGKPVIATIGGGTAEIITNNVTGLLNDPADEDGVLRDLKQVLYDESFAQCLGHAAVQVIREKFLLSNMTDQYVKLYYELSGLCK